MVWSTMVGCRYNMMLIHRPNKQTPITPFITNPQMKSNFTLWCKFRHYKRRQKTLKIIKMNASGKWTQLSTMTLHVPTEWGDTHTHTHTAGGSIAQHLYNHGVEPQSQYSKQNKTKKKVQTLSEYSLKSPSSPKQQESGTRQRRRQQTQALIQSWEGGADNGLHRHSSDGLSLKQVAHKCSTLSPLEVRLRARAAAGCDMTVRRWTDTLQL